MGRIIDADKLSADMYHEAFEKDSDMQKWDSGCWIRYKMFENVLKAQPTVEAPDINVGNMDAISRQATYLALVEKGQASKRYKIGETWELNGEEIREVLGALPSAQPEQRWIPVTERLPEEYGEYLVTYKSDGEQIFMDIIEYETSFEYDYEKNRFKGNWLFADDCRSRDPEVLAWMPLPEIYQGGGQDG